ncbi:protein phosphatase methylesterase 1-like [Sinocyclocheilus rhinocerous]|uniref:protein phosphatase methylesterase 1-like n=1 Tax=Sinocyclocheilus rhinocerous TaxID=307959 RepID=UPI0007BAA375|nr:PREDICTED: protein phosphatase methylesterase 1-like [Sinocyclocheilus rhinocerous]
MASERSSAESRSSHLSSDPSIIGTDAAANSMWEESFDTENHGAAMASRVTCRVLAMDLRGHGVTQVRHADDLSTQTMSRDVANVVRATYGEIPPPIILVGHNVGGAIAVHAAGGALLPSVVGLVAIDVVEGEKHCVICHKPASRNRCACVLQPCSVYSWRIDLSKAEKYWDGWFRGISNLFLSCNVPKLLLLAGIDRLDRDLTIGQMQGKFMMQVLPPCGHAVHEDIPDKVADALASFMIRHKFAEARSETKSSSYPFMR